MACLKTERKIISSRTLDKRGTGNLFPFSVQTLVKIITFLISLQSNRITERGQIKLCSVFYMQSTHNPSFLSFALTKGWRSKNSLCNSSWLLIHIINSYDKKKKIFYSQMPFSKNSHWKLTLRGLGWVTRPWLHGQQYGNRTKLCQSWQLGRFY